MTGRPLAATLIGVCAVAGLAAVCLGADDATFDIAARRARLNIDPAFRRLTCTDTLTIRRRDGGDGLFLSLPWINELADVRIGGERVSFTRDRNGFHIEDFPEDSTVDIVLETNTKLPVRTEFSAITEDRAFLKEEEIFATGPRAYDLTRLTVVVPPSWSVAAPGTLVSADSTAEEATFVYENRARVAVIGWVCAGAYRRTAATVGGAPSVDALLFSADSTDPRPLMELARKVVGFYSREFSPYRFAKLTIVEIDDWVAGKGVLAIAEPSLVLVKSMAFTTKDEYNRVEEVLGHEIAHQWWPISVFAAPQDYAFLSEGMCEYSARLYNESAGVLGRRDSLEHHPLLRPLLARVARGTDLPLQQNVDLRYQPTQYLKGALVHHMLRATIGDSAFGRLYREYAGRYTGRVASMADFQQLAEEVSGQRLGWFFEQWVRNTGVPRLRIYGVKTALQGEEWVTRGRVRILGYEKFTTLAPVVVRAGDESIRTLVRIGTDTSGAYRNDVEFQVRTRSRPQVALLDPGGDFLKMRKIPAKLSDLRDPATGIMIVGTGAHGEYLLGRARRDSAEIERTWWGVTIKPDTAVTLQDLQRDRVFLYGKPSENRIVAEMAKKFPFGFRGDSAVVGGEAVFDSSLTLLQAIDNPYNANGLLSWIAPLSPLAAPELRPFDASWVLLRGDEEVSSGTWEVEDKDLVAEVR